MKCRSHNSQGIAPYVKRAWAVHPVPKSDLCISVFIMTVATRLRFQGECNKFCSVVTNETALITKSLYSLSVQVYSINRRVVIKDAHSKKPAPRREKVPSEAFGENCKNQKIGREWLTVTRSRNGFETTITSRRPTQCRLIHTRSRTGLGDVYTWRQ